MKRTFAGTFAFIALLASWPCSAQACAACMGDVNSKSAGAINAAIFLMIGVIGAMLSSLAAFGLYLYRRNAGAASAAPGDDTLDT